MRRSFWPDKNVMHSTSSFWTLSDTRWHYLRKLRLGRLVTCNWFLILYYYRKFSSIKCISTMHCPESHIWHPSRIQKHYSENLVLLSFCLPTNFRSRRTCVKWYVIRFTSNKKKRKTTRNAQAFKEALAPPNLCVYAGKMEGKGFFLLCLGETDWMTNKKGQEENTIMRLYFLFFLQMSNHL